MRDTRRGNKRQLAGVGVLLLGLLSMMIGFVGVAGTASATGGGATGSLRETQTGEGAPDCLTGKVPTWLEERTRTYDPGHGETTHTVYSYVQVVKDFKTEYHFSKFTQERTKHGDGAWSAWGPWTEWSPETHTSWEDSTDPLGSPAFHSSGTRQGGITWQRQWQAQFDGDTREVPNGSHEEFSGDVTEPRGAPWVKIDERLVGNGDAVPESYGEWTEWAKIPGSDSWRDMTEAEVDECWVADSERQTRVVDGAPDCETQVVSTWSERRSRTEVSEGVWGEWSGWTKVVGSDGTRVMTEAELAECWVAGTERETRVVDGTPDCETQTVSTWTEDRSRTETAKGVWGEWSDWAKVEGTDGTRAMTEAELAECWVAGTERETRVVDGAPDCDTRTVEIWTEERTRTETAKGVWGEWSEWSLVEDSEDTRTMTDAEIAECTDVLPSESTSPTPQGPKDTQGPNPVVAPAVIGVEAQAPAAVPTAVDAGLSQAVGSEGINLWVMVGAALAVLGLLMGFVPVPARGRYSR